MINFIKDHNKIAIALVVVSLVIAVVVIGIATVLLLNQLIVKTDTTDTVKTQTTSAQAAENSRVKGVSSEDRGDTAAALQAYKDAYAAYKQSGNSDGMLDMESKIKLMEQILASDK